MSSDARCLNQAWLLVVLGALMGLSSLPTISCGSSSEPSTCEDVDQDEFQSIACGGTDCNDSNPNIHPGADEICDDGRDNDCDGFTDAEEPECSASCPDPNQKRCLGNCVNPKTDKANCGICGHACDTSQVCLDGTCSSSCGGSTPDLCGTTCTDKNTDKINCGTCGKICDAGQKCQAGSCVCENDKLTLCGIGCFDTTSDPKHCGGCTAPECVNPKPLCVGSTCAASCSEPTPNLCGTTCTNFKTDKANCGDCGSNGSDHICSGSQACENGSCTTANCGGDGNSCCSAPNECTNTSSACHQGTCKSISALCSAFTSINTCADNNVLVKCAGTGSPGKQRCGTCTGSGNGWHDYCDAECGGNTQPCCKSGSSHVCSGNVTCPSNTFCPVSCTPNCGTTIKCGSAPNGCGGANACGTCTSGTCTNGTCQGGCTACGTACCQSNQQCCTGYNKCCAASTESCCNGDCCNNTNEDCRYDGSSLRCVSCHPPNDPCANPADCCSNICGSDSKCD